MLLACNSAGTKYRNDLKQKRKASVDSDKQLKRKQLPEELSIVKKRKVEMESLANELNCDADKFIVNAGRTDDSEETKKLVPKANSFKQRVKEARN